MKTYRYVSKRKNLHMPPLHSTLGVPQSHKTIRVKQPNRTVSLSNNKTVPRA